MKSSKKKKKIIKSPKTVYVNVNHTKYLTVKNCIQNLGWKFTDSNMKNILFWCDSEGTIEFAQRLNRWQFYNHFPGMWSIAHKIELVRYINKMHRMLPKIYTFHPKTFILPSEFTNMQSYMASKARHRERTMIIKPDKGAQGKGIIIVQDADELYDYDESAVAQKYIPPLLIKKKKFDLRIYVLVTSVDPLRIYIFKEGMARFCTDEYRPPRSSNLDDSYSHLTNFSLNKKNTTFDFKENKRSLTDVMQQLSEMNIDTDKIMNGIDMIIRMTLIAVQPFLSSNYHTAVPSSDGKSRCFEILGFDILLDDKAKPWLLEVNCMPSLAGYSEFDEDLKSRVISGTLKILDLQPNFKKKCMERFRLLSIQRNTTFEPIFDPEKETQIASTTDWRQIFPIIDDSQLEEICNDALLFSAGKGKEVIKKQQQQLQQSSRKESPKKRLIETAKLRPATIESLQRRIPIEDKHLQKSNNSIIHQPKAEAPKKLPHSGTETPYMLDTPIPMVEDVKKNVEPLQKLIKPFSSKSNNRTPRSVVLANEARAQRINALGKRATNYDKQPFQYEYRMARPNYIIEAEERERVKLLQRQCLLASSVSMLQRMKVFLRMCETQPNVAKPPDVVTFDPKQSVFPRRSLLKVNLVVNGPKTASDNLIYHTG